MIYQFDHSCKFTVYTLNDFFVVKKAARYRVKIIIFLLLAGCHSSPDKQQDQLYLEHIADSTTEASIDSAYAVIKNNCDTMLKYNVPLMADSITKNILHSKNNQPKDSSLIITVDSFMKMYNGIREKIQGNYSEKAITVIRQLKADCDTSLQKETYNRVRQLLPAKRLQRPEKKNRRGG